MNEWQKMLLEAQRHAKNAQQIASKNGGQMTASDRAEYEKERDAAFAAQKKSEHLKRVADDDALIKSLSGTYDTAPDSDDNGDFGDRNHAGALNGSSWAKAVIGQLTKAAGRPGRLEQRTGEVSVKALLTGTLTVPPAVEIAPLPPVPVTMIDLIPKKETVGATDSYLRQTVRTNNAAVVADNALKPTSVFTYAPIDSKARVIAHLSEPFPERFLTDYESLAEILDGEMNNGVLVELEDRIVNGSGTGEDFHGILTTTGVTAVPFSSSVITTLRKARTALDVKGEKPNGWVMHPTDAEALDLLREDGATGGFLMDSAAYDAIFGPGTVRITSLAVPVGTALFADWSKLRLRVRQGVHTLASNQSGDLFQKNQVQLRSEGRFELEILRPQAVAVVDLTA